MILDRRRSWNFLRSFYCGRNNDALFHHWSLQTRSACAPLTFPYWKKCLQNLPLPRQEMKIFWHREQKTFRFLPTGKIFFCVGTTITAVLYFARRDAAARDFWDPLIPLMITDFPGWFLSIKDVSLSPIIWTSSGPFCVQIWSFLFCIFFSHQSSYFFLPSFHLLPTMQCPFSLHPYIHPVPESSGGFLHH